MRKRRRASDHRAHERNGAVRWVRRRWQRFDAGCAGLRAFAAGAVQFQLSVTSSLPSLGFASNGTVPPFASIDASGFVPNTWASGESFHVRFNYSQVTFNATVTVTNMNTSAARSFIAPNVDLRAILGSDPQSCSMAYFGWTASTQAVPSIYNGSTMSSIVIDSYAYLDAWPTVPPLTPPGPVVPPGALTTTLSDPTGATATNPLCDYDACAWVVSSWSPCNVTCGLGYVNRYVVCRSFYEQELSLSVILARQLGATRFVAL